MLDEFIDFLEHKYYLLNVSMALFKSRKNITIVKWFNILVNLAIYGPFRKKEAIVWDMAAELGHLKQMNETYLLRDKEDEIINQ